jgi:hypothetical protein
VELKEEFPAVPPLSKPVPVEQHNYRFGGYGQYFAEMARLHQFPGLAKELRDRALET